MDAQLSHRGPDGRAVLGLKPIGGVTRFDPGLSPAEGLGPCAFAMAFRRLRIQDRDPAADAPLGSADGRCFIVLNGEIYNFRQLRDELAAEGVRFRTRSDTEVALASYRRWGHGCFERFNGIWALLILDLERRVLVGSRDRLGVKPLFYAEDRGSLLLASEPKAVAAGLDSGMRVEPGRLVRYLRGLPPAAPDAGFFRGVERVPAGCVFEVPLEPSEPHPAFRRFWSLRQAMSRAAPPPTADAARDELLSLVRDAVRLQGSAEVPVGTLLSGGLDSSLVTRLLAQLRSGSSAPAFSLVYEEPEMDESRYIDAVLAQGDVDGIRHTLAPSEAWSLTDDVIDAQGEPLLGWDLIAQYRVFRLAREYGVTVVLDGQGADEILGGYPMYEGVVLRAALRRAGPLRFLAELRALARKYELSSPKALRRFVLGPIVRALRRPSYGWLEKRAEETATADQGWEPLPGGTPALDRVLYEQTLLTNLPAVLGYQDRNSMRHAVESRVPYLDHRVVELSFRLPPEFKVGLGDRKRTLRAAARHILPGDVTERLDMKAIVSTRDWISLREREAEVREALCSRRLADLPWLHPGRLRKFVDAYFAGKHGDLFAVWRLYAASRWLEIFRPTI
jgi:asparagine synthase (glutamine-hydrolysing)